jgi:hypothetical protein
MRDQLLDVAKPRNVTAERLKKFRICWEATTAYFPPAVVEGKNCVGRRRTPSNGTVYIVPWETNRGWKHEILKTKAEANGFPSPCAFMIS